MTIDKKADGNRLELKVSGRLDTMTAPELEGVIKENLDGVTELALDFQDLEYISSAGLRVLVATQKMMAQRGGNLRLLSPNDDVQEVFEMTGLADVFNIER